MVSFAPLNSILFFFLQAKREEAEDAFERMAGELDLEESNLSKKIEILDTSIVDEQQGVHYLNIALESFSTYAEQTGAGVLRLLQGRLEETSTTLENRVRAVNMVLDWFDKSPNFNADDLVLLWKQFDEGVLPQVLADLDTDATKTLKGERVFLIRARASVLPCLFSSDRRAEVAKRWAPK